MKSVIVFTLLALGCATPTVTPRADAHTLRDGGPGGVDATLRDASPDAAQDSDVGDAAPVVLDAYVGWDGNLLGDIAVPFDEACRRMRVAFETTGCSEDIYWCPFEHLPPPLTRGPSERDLAACIRALACAGATCEHADWVMRTCGDPFRMPGCP